jgi:phage terminase large subunit
MNEINTIFRPLYTSTKRYFLLTGGRASLKSSTVHDFVARLTYETNHGILFTRYTMASAEKSIIPEFIAVLHRLRIAQDFMITRDKITNLKTGSFIYFSGIKTSSGDQTAKLKSIAGITTWIIEEGEDFVDEKAFDSIDDSIRTRERQNRIIWIQNPSTKEHFIYQRWIAPNNKRILVQGLPVTVSSSPLVEHIHSTYHIATQYLSEAWIAKADTHKRNMIAMSQTEVLKSWYYINYIGGWLDKAEGAVFESWIEGEFDDTLPSCFGLDYGYNPDPLGLVKVAVDERNKKIYVKEHLYEVKLSNQQIKDKFASIVGVRSNNLIVCDTNEPRTTNELRQYGFNIQTAVKREIKEDIREMQPYQLIIDPASMNLKRELNNYVWNDKKASIPVDAWNHLIDPTRYAWRRLTTKRRKGLRRAN